MGRRNSILERRHGKGLLLRVYQVQVDTYFSLNYPDVAGDDIYCTNNRVAIVDRIRTEAGTEAGTGTEERTFC